MSGTGPYSKSVVGWRVRVCGEHYAVLVALHEHLIKAIRNITGEHATRIYNSSTGPARPPD